VPAGLKAENYLLNCRVDTISSPSKQAPRIFQTSPEHPNARIIITPPYAAKTRPSSAPGDIFDPQLPSKAPPRRPTLPTTISDDGTRRTSGRKRTVTGKYDDGGSVSDSDSLDEVYSSRKRKQPRYETKETTAATTALETTRRRKSSTKLLESSELSTPKKKDGEKVGSRPQSGNKSNREKEARLDRRENEELYETLQKQVTIDLLKRRYFLTI
jgi:hypothetical protein